jgi:hypothetical protein
VPSDAAARDTRAWQQVAYHLDCRITLRVLPAVARNVTEFAVLEDDAADMARRVYVHFDLERPRAAACIITCPIKTQHPMRFSYRYVLTYSSSNTYLDSTSIAGCFTKQSVSFF